MKAGQSSSEQSDVQLEDEISKRMSISMKHQMQKKPVEQIKNIFINTPQAKYVNIDNEGDSLSASLMDQLAVQKPALAKKQPSGLIKKVNPSGAALHYKTSISMKKEKISEFFYYQNYIVCKGQRKILVYNLLDKALIQIPIKQDEFILNNFPPYVFNCIIGQYLHLYTEQTVEQIGEIMTSRKNKIKKQHGPSHSWAKSLQSDDQEIKLERNQVIILKISKLEVECICKYNQGHYMGGYNRSVLPGGKKSQRRELYYMEHLDPTINNKPKQKIKIQNSILPVSMLQVQSPYLITYCKPNFYFFSLKTHQLLLTFQKDSISCFLLEGRYAQNTLNGIGICGKDNRRVFTFDLESIPIYGVEINQHQQEATQLCMEKTGRIFGCQGSSVFQYIPSKHLTRCVKMYQQNETVIWIESTPNNNFLVLRQNQRNEYVIEAFSIDQTSCIY